MLAHAMHPNVHPRKSFSMSLYSTHGVFWLMTVSGSQDHDPCLWQCSSSW
jgi:hypothetical protein